jgi:hypothetical protein
MKLQLEELEADAAEDDLIAKEAPVKTTMVTAFERDGQACKPFSDQLPRERVVVPAPCSCPASAGIAQAPGPVSRGLTRMGWAQLSRDAPVREV